MDLGPARTGTLPPTTDLGDGVVRVEDTCAVYLVRDATDPTRAICVDFGSGTVLDHLADLGVVQVTDVLMTHHHRDQGQGLHRAVGHGARIHVPPVERDLFGDVEDLWARRGHDNDYDLYQDTFSLLASVPVASTVPEYREAVFGGVRVTTIPTPGHTVGSVTYLLDRGGRRLAFTGDLIHSAGKVWSLAATQWTYTGREGAAYVVLSAELLARREPDLLLPSHGAPVHDAVAALRLLVDRMRTYVDSRSPHRWEGLEELDDPFVPITEHLLLNRSSWMCTSYVLLSRTGEALLVDYGYDMYQGAPAGSHRATRRPWLESLPALRERYGVTRVSVAMPTHYHDDHVAGMPLLREVEGTELWIPASVAAVLADPRAQDLPCQWYDPIPADRVLPDDGTVTWNEYTIGVHPQPGHTLYAVAYDVDVDGLTVVFTGDQQEGLGGRDGRRELLNYQYRNRVRIGDYRRSAALYRRLAPGLLASGHWEPRVVDDDYLDHLAEEGAELDRMHRSLLPLGAGGLDVDGTAARMSPARTHVGRGETVTFTVTVTNPGDDSATARLALVAPPGWRVQDGPVRAVVEPHGTVAVTLSVVADGPAGRRQPVAVDVTIGDLRLGQHAHAVVDVVERR